MIHILRELQSNLLGGCLAELIKGHHCFIAQSFEAIFPIIAKPIKVESDSPQSDSGSYVEPVSATKAVSVIFVKPLNHSGRLKGLQVTF